MPVVHAGPIQHGDPCPLLRFHRNRRELFGGNGLTASARRRRGGRAESCRRIAACADRADGNTSRGDDARYQQLEVWGRTQPDGELTQAELVTLWHLGQSVEMRLIPARPLCVHRSGHVGMHVSRHALRRDLVSSHLSVVICHNATKVARYRVAPHMVA